MSVKRNLEIQNKYSNSFIEPHGMRMRVCMCIYILTLYMADFKELKNFNGKTHPTSKGILGIARGSNTDPAFWLRVGLQS